jgi:hypothetical protein
LAWDQEFESPEVAAKFRPLGATARASQLGAPLTPEQQLQMWEWDKRWREVVDI